MSSVFNNKTIKPENAIQPPISNKFAFENCVHTNSTDYNDKPAWWMLEISFGIAYITNIEIYYREDCKYTLLIYNIKV